MTHHLGRRRGRAGRAAAAGARRHAVEAPPGARHQPADRGGLVDVHAGQRPQAPRQLEGRPRRPAAAPSVGLVVGAGIVPEQEDVLLLPLLVVERVVRLHRSIGRTILGDAALGPGAGVVINHRVWGGALLCRRREGEQARHHLLLHLLVADLVDGDGGRGGRGGPAEAGGLISKRQEEQHRREGGAGQPQRQESRDKRKRTAGPRRRSHRRSPGPSSRRGDGRGRGRGRGRWHGAAEQEEGKGGGLVPEDRVEDGAGLSDGRCARHHHLAHSAVAGGLLWLCGVRACECVFGVSMCVRVCASICLSMEGMYVRTSEGRKLIVPMVPFK